jgi:hypothetical protein
VALSDDSTKSFLRTNLKVTGWGILMKNMKGNNLMNIAELKEKKISELTQGCVSRS